MEAPEETKAREIITCPACGGPKAVGCVVCWDCFKYCENSLKNTELPFMDWLESYDSIPDPHTRRVRDSLRLFSVECDSRKNELDTIPDLNQGKYENDHYLIGGSKYADGGQSYHIYWLSYGIRDCGYATKEAARKKADSIVEKNKLDYTTV
jgi:hypothetical protein